jgi:hypothetical protein
MKDAVFWDVRPCSLTEVLPIFWRNEITRHHSPEHGTLSNYVTNKEFGLNFERITHQWMPNLHIYSCINLEPFIAHVGYTASQNND